MKRAAWRGKGAGAGGPAVARAVFCRGAALWMLGAALAFGADFSVQGTLDPSEIPFHRTSSYTVMVEMPAETEVTVVPWTAPLPGLEVEWRDPETTSLDPGRVRVVQRIHLRPTRPARYELPAVVVRATGHPDTTLVPGILAVRPLTPEELLEATVAQDFIGLDALNAGSSFARRWTLPLLALAVTAAVILALLVRGNAGRLRWLRRQPLAPGPEALARLAVLSPGENGAEILYMELSSVLRDYLEKRFGIHARELSTRELVSGPLRDVPLTQELHSAVQTLLAEADRVKFARFEPLVTRQQAALESASHLIRSLECIAADTAPAKSRGAAA
jgi:hypothetical protein